MADQSLEDSHRLSTVSISPPCPMTGQVAPRQRVCLSGGSSAAECEIGDDEVKKPGPATGSPALQSYRSSL